MKNLLSILLVAVAIVLASCGSNNQRNNEQKVNQNSNASIQKDKALAKLRNDGHDDVYVYSDNSFPDWDNPNVTGLFLYIFPNSSLSIRMQCIEVTGGKQDLDIIKMVDITTDNEIYKLDANDLATADVSNPKWQYHWNEKLPIIDITQQGTFDMLKDIINSRSVKIKFSGNYKSFEIFMTDLQKQALQNVIDGYYVLGGKMK